MTIEPWVCWSIGQLIQDAARDDMVIHVQNQKRQSRTLCGISTTGYWDFEAHDDFGSVTCKRCLARLGANNDEYVE